MRRPYRAHSLPSSKGRPAGPMRARPVLWQVLADRPAGDCAEWIGPDRVIRRSARGGPEGNRADRRRGVEVLQLAPEAVEGNPARMAVLDFADVREGSTGLFRPGDLTTLE